MEYRALLERAATLPVIETSTLRSWGEEPRALSVQLTRWVKAGKLVMLRRGVYLLPPALRRVSPSLEYLANLLVTPSYVSFERALALHGLVPERVPLVQSVTTARPGLFQTPVGDFEYRHVKPSWFMGYRELPVGPDHALVATPEKALLDTVYFSTGPFTEERIEELRLQNLEVLDANRLLRLAAGQGKRVEPAAAALARWLRRSKRRESR
jgi:predicted transcriptional regulator of viral defense system